MSEARKTAAERSGFHASWRFWAAVAASVLLHAVFSPVPAWLGVLGLAFRETPLDEPPVDEIPIELLTEEVQPPATGEGLSAPPAVADVQTEPPPAPKVSAPAPAPKKEAPPKASAHRPPRKELNGPGSGDGERDPVALAGDAGKVVDSNANVRVLLYCDRIREHELGPRVSELLSRTPQWGEFFGPAGVDPIRDIDRVLFAGPSLRSTANMIAVVEHHLPEPAIAAAFEGLVEGGGEWLSRKPLMVRATADRAPRVFASPGGKIVAVAPPSAEKSLKRLKKNLTFPAGPEGVFVQLYVKELARLAQMFRLPFGDTLGAGRAMLSASERGGVLIQLTIDDKDKVAVSEHARKLESLVTELTQVDLSRFGALGALAQFALGGQTTRFVESVRMGERNGAIEGEIRVTRSQLLTLMDLLDGALPPRRRSARPSGSARSPADSVPGSSSAVAATPEASGGTGAALPGSSTPRESPDEGRRGEEKELPGAQQMAPTTAPPTSEVPTPAPPEAVEPHVLAPVEALPAEPSAPRVSP